MDTTSKPIVSVCEGMRFSNPFTPPYVPIDDTIPQHNEGVMVCQNKMDIVSPDGMILINFGFKCSLDWVHAMSTLALYRNSDPNAISVIAVQDNPGLIATGHLSQIGRYIITGTKDKPLMPEEVFHIRFGTSRGGAMLHVAMLETTEMPNDSDDVETTIPKQGCICDQVEKVIWGCRCSARYK